MPQLIEYVLRIAPGLALAALLLGLLPREQSGARLCVHLGLFVLVRDAMTPVGLWQIGKAPVFWLRLAHASLQLIALAVASLGLLFGCLWLERGLARPIVWLRSSAALGVAAGAGCALLIAAPLLLLGHGTDVSARGGTVPTSLLLPLLVFSLAGNAYEELLFRGFLQSFVAERLGAARAVLIAGLAFAFGHAFLATSLTDVGVPVLAFTAYEGLICTELCRRTGLLPAVVAHGGGIFIVASGIG